MLALMHVPTDTCGGSRTRRLVQVPHISMRSWANLGLTAPTHATPLDNALPRVPLNRKLAINSPINCQKTQERTTTSRTRSKWSRSQLPALDISSQFRCSPRHRISRGAFLQQRRTSGFIPFASAHHDGHTSSGGIATPSPSRADNHCGARQFCRPDRPTSHRENALSPRSNAPGFFSRPSSLVAQQSVLPPSRSTAHYNPS
ncbi:hypothetical protein F4802DRAFT_275195 [Xylaria palmicola]|nr:hypothetical protein F4802DRAFT_275195 [Xylaria palmicola]